MTATSTHDDSSSVEDTEYIVRLLFRIPAASPKEAVEHYIEQILLHGLRNWSYRVEDETTGEMWHLDGYGEPFEHKPIAVGDEEDDAYSWDEAEAEEPAIIGSSLAGDLDHLLKLSRGEIRPGSGHAT